MKIQTDNDFFIVIVSLIIFFVIIGMSITLFVLFYYRRRKSYLRENELLRADFEKLLLHSRLEIQEQIFNSISGEIHDNVGQMLSFAKVQLNILAEKGSFDGSLIVSVKDTINQVIQDLRNIAKGLNSENIQFSSLPDIVARETERINRSGFLEATFAIQGVECDMEKDLKLILFRIIQESLQNILKHANAQLVKIVFMYLPDKISINISDDGKGFDFEKEVRRNDGIGLKNILQRAALIGGIANVSSMPGKGTTITIDAPYAS
jgi:two-component system NarL family sensor kinase